MPDMPPSEKKSVANMNLTDAMRMWLRHSISDKFCVQRSGHVLETLERAGKRNLPVSGFQ